MPARIAKTSKITPNQNKVNNLREIGFVSQKTFSTLARGRPLVMMMLMLVSFRVDRNHATRFGYRAIHMLELHRGVADMEAIEQHVINVVQHAVACRRRHVFNQHVTTQRV